jgi:hypothetical protein
MAHTDQASRQVFSFFDPIEIFTYGTSGSAVHLGARAVQAVQLEVTVVSGLAG